MGWDEALAAVAHFDRKYAMGENEQHMLYDIAIQLPPGSTIVEIGVCHGSTSGILAQAAAENDNRYVGIDPFWLEGNEATYRRDMDSLGVAYEIMVMPSNAAAEQWDDPIDLLVIDGDHSAKAIEDDCDNWIPWVNPGGVVAFDDWADPTTSDVPFDNAHLGITLFGKAACRGWDDWGQVGRMKLYRRPAENWVRGRVAQGARLESE